MKPLSPLLNYSPEKTLVDCFKFRNKVGLDIVIEAIRFYRERKKIDVDDLMRYATICRVDKIMRPYLEAINFLQSVFVDNPARAYGRQREKFEVF